MTDVLDLAKRLMAAPSVTPATGAVFDALEAMLAPLGFKVTRFTRGEGAAGTPEAPVENLFAIRRGPEGSRHLAFAGHLDVVPPGGGWTSEAFEPEVRGELLYGRGAVDMKGAIACMVDAAAQVPAEAGTISFIITGDEEGPALHGTRALIDFMREAGHQPDLCLVGEPTSVNRLGDMMKIGRRGSMTAYFEVTGQQGHAAYPHRARNPLPAMARLMDRLASHELDKGTAHFDATTLSVVTIDTGNPANNVIPASSRATVNIRFSDVHSGESLSEWLRSEAEAVAKAFDLSITVRIKISGESFVTPPGPLSDVVARAVKAETGIDPELSTSGGTSDARFVKDHCPVVEFGLVGKTMHAVDEHVEVAQIHQLKAVYSRILKDYFA